MDGKEKRKRCVVIKAYTLKQLADIYCVTKYIMRQLIKRNKKVIGEREGYYYQTQQVEVIFKTIQLPSNVDLE
jgi:hypothetical protein